ncbi:MAG: ImmA/IrrE family metallo-endopeptidase, partial [Beijerinckiaceae bacterium]
KVDRAVPVLSIAHALDILEIREVPTKGFEGALVMAPDRNVGAIVVNGASTERRQRFTIGHELAHFLNPRHKPTDPERGFVCRKDDLNQTWRPSASRLSSHAVQEAEANRFAIELLAPATRFRPFLRGMPTLDHVVQAATALDISKEASARRYIELRGGHLAVVFSENGALRYLDRTPDFPFIGLSRDSRHAHLDFAGMEEGLGAQDEVDPRDWGINPNAGTIVAETLRQANGFAMTLLFIEVNED